MWTCDHGVAFGCDDCNERQAAATIADERKAIAAHMAAMCGHTSAAILKMSIADDTWVNVGYGKRQKIGRLVNLLFRPKWRRDLEDSLLREIVSILTAAYLLAGLVRQTNIDVVIEVYVDGTGGDLFRTFGFLSRSEALSYFSDAIREYHEAARPLEADADVTGDAISRVVREWASILWRRIEAAQLPDRGLSAQLFGGSARFALTVKDMLFLLKRQEWDDSGERLIERVES